MKTSPDTTEESRKKVLDALSEAWREDPSLTFAHLVAIVFDPIPPHLMDETKDSETLKLISEAKAEIVSTKAVEALRPKNFRRLSIAKQWEIDDENRKKIQAGSGAK